MAHDEICKLQIKIEKLEFLVEKLEKELQEIKKSMQQNNTGISPYMLSMMSAQAIQSKYEF